MDMAKMVAEWIEQKLDIPAEAEPSPGNIRGPHFVVAVVSFWEEPDGTVFDTDHNFEDDGAFVEGYDTAVRISVKYVQQGSGEKFRSDFMEQARSNALFFSEQKIIPILGGKVYGPALERMRSVIPDIDDHNINSPVGLGYVLSLGRDPDSDVMFRQVKRGDSRAGYIATQAFLGHIALRDGALQMEI